LPNLIIIRNDGSTDNTADVLAQYAANYPFITLVQDDLGNIGIQRSCSLLLREALKHNPDYILYADQDDIWLPSKIEKQLAAIISIAQPDKPALVFTDAQVVDQNLQLLHPSLRELQKLDMPQESTRLKALLLYCPALGCTMIFNKKLAQAIASIPSTNFIQDKWTLIFATVFGNVLFLPETTILHRQHQQNVTGAMHGIKRRIFSRQNLAFLQRRYQTALDQAREIEKTIPNLPYNDKEVIQQFILLFTGNYFERILNYFRFWLAPPHWKRKAGLFISLFFTFK
jgi:glycosyltransferase involved in cell wall biosynthesis